MFVCSRSFYLSLNEKVFLFQCKCCIETRFSRCSSQEFAGFTVLICLQFSEILYVDITCKCVKPGVKGNLWNFSHLICDSYQAKISRSFLKCEKFPSLLFSRSCDRNFVFVTVTKAKIFACEGLGNFPKKLFSLIYPDFLPQKFNGPRLCR